MNDASEPATIALTLGDPAGIGPEIICAAWSDLDRRTVRPMVVGPPIYLQRAAHLLGLDLHVESIESPSDLERLDDAPTVVPCLWLGGETDEDVPPRVISAAGGEAAYQAILLATRLALREEIAGIATAPINKASLHAAGHDYPGHTELLADLCGAAKFAMMLHVPPGPHLACPHGLNIVHATLHVAMREALDQLTTARIVEAGELVNTVTSVLMRAVGATSTPRIGVCALNPHAGEGGLFGNEESTVIAPAVDELCRRGIHAQGPYPADTLIRRAASGEFDGVVAMYHDQGHIAVKLLEMQRAVNITLGLPIIRTSVAHGTAFDRAWQGTASHEGLIEAVRVCAQLHREKERLMWDGR
ncbi:MAG: 4-hydroxythreonine-4-phosphate dehydrogenase PdxA [Planctomycetales bacterium]|nr:4-hydroxythreonine-4-phosphate dehydrogenase PdxA [Planctomycetales bacterium]